MTLFGFNIDIANSSAYNIIDLSFNLPLITGKPHLLPYKMNYWKDVPQLDSFKIKKEEKILPLTH